MPIGKQHDESRQLKQTVKCRREPKKWRLLNEIVIAMEGKMREPNIR